jgi:hypothetical protein
MPVVSPVRMVLFFIIKLMPSFAGKGGLGIHSVRLSCFPSRQANFALPLRAL